MYTGYYKWPMGILKISADMMGVRVVGFADSSEVSSLSGEEPLEALSKWQNSGDIHGYELYTEVCSQLDLYFDGKLKQFDLPLKPVGTDFQKKVWRMLMTTLMGRQEPIRRLPNWQETAGLRAVGMANNNNPIAIIVPCHRVVGADGSLTGYAGGTDIKQWLLDHESAAADRMTNNST